MPSHHANVIFVTGATGNVGQNVVARLLERGAPVRALSRDAEAADLPPTAEVVEGDLIDPHGLVAHLDGVAAVLLIWPFFGAKGAEEVVQFLAGRELRIVYLSAEAAGRQPGSFWARIERAIEGSTAAWTFLRPTGFAANTLMWAEQIRQTGVVRWPFGAAARSLIHERDIAEVATRALTEDRHLGARYVLSGPEALTQRKHAQEIGRAIGRTIRWQELSREDAERELAERIPDTALDTWASFIDRPEIVTSTVEDVTGKPARAFADWARDHVDDFR